MTEESKDKKDESQDTDSRDTLTEDKPGHLPQDQFGDPEYPRKKKKKKPSGDEDTEESDDDKEGEGDE